jgi:hypothetical protein
MKGWLVAALPLVIATQAAAEPPAATRALVERLKRSGRAEARLVQTVTAAGETLRADRGRVALEHPDRLRLDFTGSGERVTMRGDGGEWLQPSLRQLFVLRAEQAQTVVALWRAFLGDRERSYDEREVRPRVYRLVPRVPDPTEPDSLEVRLGVDRLPSHVVAWSGDQRWSLALAGWKLTRPRGAEAFTLRAPPGYEVFEWP